MSKLLVVFCSRSCHGSGSGITTSFLHQIQKVLFVMAVVNHQEKTSLVLDFCVERHRNE